MSPGVIGGTVNPGGFLGPLIPDPTFVYGIPGGSLYLAPNGNFQNFAPTAVPGGSLSGGGVGGMRSSVIVAGGPSIPPGGALSGGGVGGMKSMRHCGRRRQHPFWRSIERRWSGRNEEQRHCDRRHANGWAWRRHNYPGGTAGALSGGKATGSASSVIVTGGSTN